MRASDVPPVSNEPHQGPASLPTTGLFVTSVLHALPLGWAAVMLPMKTGSWLTLVLAPLALLHATVAVLALSRRPRALLRAWRVLALYSLTLLLGLSIVIAGSALYLSELYRGVGAAVAAALFGIWGLLVLLTVPVSAWGLAYTLGGPARRRGAAAALASGLLSGLLVLLAGRAARAEPIAPALNPALLGTLAAASASTGARPALGTMQRAPLAEAPPARCEHGVDSGVLTLLASSFGPNGKPFSACLQASDGEALGRALRQLLDERGTSDSPLKLDLVQAVQELPRVHPLLDALSIRPGLDGVCGPHLCLAPWQLVARDAFTRFRPLAAVRDASFGVSLRELAIAVGVTAASDLPLYRVATASALVEGGRLVPFARMRPREVSHDAAALDRAIALASNHILAAQSESGAFRYLLDPFTGQGDRQALNLPRQAGTTLALCELTDPAASREVVRRALAQLRGFERRLATLSAISMSEARAPLGESALPLIAFASCRSHVGSEHDELIGRLAQLMLALQRADGSFFAELDLTSGRARGEHQGLYAAGQALFALVLVEQLARAGVHPALPPRDVLHDAVERAMAYYGRSYWPRALRSLFYLEENWHCLAARAALTSHRHDDYERFCLDYVEFKSRLILSEADDADPDHVGGYGFSNMFPPHSTTTSGYAEALAAAISVKHARGLPLAEDAQRMERAHRFLLRQQWTPESCFACAPGKEAIGGFSESAASPVIRIDYVQHALAGLAHGQKALALRGR